MERWIDDKFGRFFWEWGAEVLGAGGRGRGGEGKSRMPAEVPLHLKSGG